MGFYLVQLLTGLSNACALFLVASGLTLIFGVTRIVNFSHGSFYMLGAYIAYTLVEQSSGAFGFWGSLLLAGIAVGIIGLIVELIVLKPIYKSPELYQLVATFGVILVIQDLAQWIWGAEDLFGRRAPGFKGENATVDIAGTLMPTYDLAIIAIALSVLGILWFIFNRTRFGILVRAATLDREMVSALGVNQSLLFSGVFFLGSMLAGIGGAVQLPKGGASLLMDFEILSPIFVVVVIGGMGSIWGVFVASILVSVLQAFGVLFFPQSTLVLMFLVMAVVLIFRPWGLYGKEESSTEHAAGEIKEPLREVGSKMKMVFLTIIALLIISPIFLEGYNLNTIIDVLVFCLFAASLHYILGTGGLVSFGHAAFYGGGAYAAALLVTYANTPMELAIFFAPFLAGFVALIIGWFCVRLTGVYFAMLTLAFAQVLWSIVFQWSAVTKGDDGLTDVYPQIITSGSILHYYVVLILAVGGIILLRAMAHTPFGYSLRGGRDSSLRSEAIGMDVKLIQMSSFVFAGAMAGLAGSLFVFTKGSVFPDEMTIARSFDALLMVFLGGVQSLTGPISGAAAFTLLHEWLVQITEYWRGCLGILIICIVILLPNGLAGIGELFRNIFTKTPKEEAAK
jgi:branched-chain amino acid transport system permease protein